MAVNYFLSTVGNDVEVFNNYATFRQATADNESDIPGYLYEEVNSISYENNGSNCKALVSYFISRLQCQSPYVKTKVLNLLIHLAKNGHKNVLHHLKVDEVAIKKAANVSGSPTDLSKHGVYANVRKLAKELLQLIFSEEPADEAYHPEGLQNICGLGSSASSKNLPGFGNEVFKQKTLSERVTEHVSHAVQNILSPNAENEYYKEQAKILAESLPHYSPVCVSKAESYDPYSLPSQAVVKPKAVSRPCRRVHVAGKPGGGWDDSDEENESTADIMSAKESTGLSMSEDSLENKTELLPCLEWTEEQKLLNDFTVDEPLEMLSCPEIELVCKQSSSLNCDKICEFIVEKLSLKEKENVKLRCLVLLEYLLHYDVVTAESVISIALPLLQKLSESHEKSIQIKSKKISLILASLSGHQATPKKVKDHLYLPLVKNVF